MKLSDVLKNITNEENEPNEISILLTDEVLTYCDFNIVLESKWLESGFKDWMYRVDPEDPRIPLKRHIHIAKKKHTSSKDMQVSWNTDGTRHDKNSFNQNIGNIERVREIARSVLKMKPEVTLEHVSINSTQRLLVEDISLSSDEKVAYIFLHIS